MTESAFIAADAARPVADSEYRLLLQNDFHLFLHRSFSELNPRTRFLDNWHIAVLAANLEDVRARLTKRLIGNLPPRHLKSHAASVAFPAWWLCAASLATIGERATAAPRGWLTGARERNLQEKLVW